MKIDVEGFEVEVFKGLSTPIRCFSFEFTTLQREVGIEALGLLDGLGRYRFNYSLGEEHRLVLDHWVSSAEMSDVVASLPTGANSGDIYARQDVPA